MNDVKYINLPIGADFLAVADALVEARDADALGKLGDVLTTLILANIAGDDVSLIEINEYIGEACELLEAGKAPADVKASSIRRLLNDDGSLADIKQNRDWR